MPKEDKKTVPKAKGKKETAPSSKPKPEKAAAPKAKATKDTKTKKFTMMAPKKYAKAVARKMASKSGKKISQRTVNKIAGKLLKRHQRKPSDKVRKMLEKKAARKAARLAAKAGAKKSEKKEGKSTTKKTTKPQKKEAKVVKKADGKKKPTLPAVVSVGRKKDTTTEKTQKKSRKTPAELPKILQSKKKVTKKTVKDTRIHQKPKKRKNPNFVARPKSFHIGGDLPPRRDLSRMVKWPKYIRLQRKKKIMYNRLKVPAMINQFTDTLNKHGAKILFRLLKKYKPETKKSRKSRLLGLARAKRAGKKIIVHKPYMVKYGASQVTHLIEQRRAKLVIIANDVDPIEHVIFIPTLCRKMHIPYCIVKNKSRLGKIVHLKNCAVMCLTKVRHEDKIAFGAIRSMCKNKYNRNADHIVRNVGGGKLGLRSAIALRKREEALKKASLQKQVA